MASLVAVDGNNVLMKQGKQNLMHNLRGTNKILL